MCPEPIEINFLNPTVWWNPKRIKWGRYVWLSGVALVFLVSLVVLFLLIKIFYISYATSQNTQHIKESLSHMKQVQSQLSQFDLERETPKWKLAEKLLQEKSIPWSRLLYELEVALPDGVRLRNIQKTRGADQQVVLKFQGESTTEEGKVKFIQQLGSSSIFKELILERENQGSQGGWEFEMTLPVKNVLPTIVSPAQSQKDIR
ncbi:MAG: PilN domain-containing protein [Holophagaceae bacterium]|jgi:Tfp pilus assembly protein PilN